MDFLISYTQEKIEKKSNNISKCDLKLTYDKNSLIYNGNFDLDYSRYGVKKHIRIEHKLTIDLITGDIEVFNNLINNGLVNNIFSKGKNKNNFKSLVDLCDDGFIKGEKRFNFWGKKYNDTTNKIFDKISGLLKPQIKSEFNKNKNYKIDFTIQPLYDLIIDFHLDKKNIKGHNNIYFDIQNDYPKKKWLIKNDYKYLPSVLDNYGIKSKYLIAELNKKRDYKINIPSINYFCKLFGENYVDYFKSGSWKKHCFDLPPNNKTHILLNDSEKKYVLTLMMKTFVYDNQLLLHILNKLFSIRNQLSLMGYNLKFNAKNDVELTNLLEIWNGYKSYVNRGYKWKYDINDDVKKLIETEIVINGNTFKPKMILTEEDFRLEGLIMKNCMSKQFPNGAIYLFVSLENNKKRINLQYRKGKLIQSYSTANSTVPKLFNESIEELNSRFETIQTITWTKQKYDIIK